MKPALRWLGAALLCGAVAGQVADHPATAQDAAASGPRGQALFEGQEHLTGRIRDHVTDLPPGVVVCENCHVRQPRTQSLPNQAPVLNEASLLTPAARRNGPISSYDRSSFCKVLRTGIDPRSIMLARAMPLFAVSPAQCASLWTFLTGNKSS